MTSVHDYEIVTYEVNLELNQIRIHTGFRNNNQILEKCDIVCNEVLAHHFE
ncbi:conserved protein of unknown function [Paenibacillus alvei]|uniref:Uncharacterized protein n=1 Tax=Paenibacillus alvei TaxID=44250 RepID=A0A383R7R6_PAEAL|nr:conserved protein of unknown function [Paenibacillus alvei]